MTTPQPKTKRPLIFELDGTLIEGNCTWEALISGTLTRPWRLPKYALAFLNHGLTGLKTALSETESIIERKIPTNSATLAFLQEETSKGRKCALWTTSTKTWADEINESLDSPFREVVGTEKTNLKRLTKAAEIEARYGTKGFDYVGNSEADIPVWKAARKCYLAGGSPTVFKKAISQGIELEQLEPLRENSQITKLLRPHQWSKNLLVLIPLIAAHKYGEPWVLGAGMLALVAFCLTASGNYVLNDIVDIKHDRIHPEKKNRPLASGAIQIPQALGIAGTTITAGLAIGWAINPLLAIALIAYLIIASTYSHWAKGVVILDATVLASLYCLRLVAGGLATQTPVSFWLISASMFLFFSLALGKRDAELSSHQKTNGRGYRHGDRTSIAAIGAASAIGATFMLCLYIQSPEALEQYKHTGLLWGLPLVCLYWSGRFWLLCGREEMKEDPVIWAIKDRATWTCGALAAICLLAAHFQT